MTVKTPMLTVVLVLLACLAFAGPTAAKPSEHRFEIVPGSFHFTPSSYQAGAHADWVTSFDFAHEPDGQTYNDVRNIAVEVPAGFDASNTAVPTCTQAQLFAYNPLARSLSDCPVASQVGTLSLEAFCHPTRQVLCQLTTPVYSMEVTSFGVTAELGFKISNLLTQTLLVSVRPSDVGLTAITPNIVNVGETHNIKFTLWGIPGSPNHDAERGMLCGDKGEIPPVCRNEFGAPQPVDGNVKPFLSNPSGCGMFKARMSAFSWQTPFDQTEETAEVGPIVECERVRFEPTIEASPSTRSAESSTGLDLSLVVPQTWENQFTIATSNLMSTKVTLPEGMTANPSLAAGLGACTPAQYASETSSSLPGAGCPPESKIGSISIETPLLAEKIPGAIYIATPYENDPEFGNSEHPGGSLLALYIVAKDPERGLLLKVAGKITPDEHTGQLVTTFARQPGVNGGPGLEGLPQQPFSKFTLEFRAGANAPLISPPTCGSYAVQGELTPWSAPEEPRLISSQPFEVTQGVHEGSCPSGGVPPFKPQVISGTQNNAGGSYSPFYLRILREDGEQELIKFSTILPPGLTGNLTGIPFCPDADVEAAKLVTGAEEEEHPSCPLASEIGHTIVEAGVGSVLAQTPGKIYLAGPYHGAPLSIVSVTSAKVGPFDLGTVVIRFALDINPITAQVEVSGAQSDPIPHIIKGIVVHVRDIRVYMDRHNFTLNPTNCQPLGITDQIVGSGSNYANPANRDTVNVSTPFEGADCASLAFKPVFKASASGKTSRTRGASLTVKLTVSGALGTQSNIRSVKVALPKQLPSRLTTLQKACADGTFNANPAACPTDSKVGIAKALTPILPVPLEGPAYFVSHGGAKFPELIVVLQGYGFTIDLHGETFISKTGITSSTFRTIPDQPVTSFELTLPQGPDSALAAPANLCATKLKMPTAFTAQNGMVIHQSTPIGVTGCAKAKKHKAKAHKKGKASKHDRHGKQSRR